MGILCELVYSAKYLKTFSLHSDFLGALLISSKLLVPRLKSSGLILDRTASRYVEMFKVNSSSLIFLGEEGEDYLSF